MLRVEATSDRVTIWQLDEHAALNTCQFRQPFADHVVRCEFDEQRCTQLTGLWNHRVVGMQLFEHTLVSDDLFDTNHLLDLKAHGVAILEHQSHQRSERNATPCFHFEHASTKICPLSFVLADIFDVFEGQLA